MKKILLASTILVGSAGVAAADVSFSGKGYMGIGTVDSGTTWVAMATAKLNVAMSGETDGGLMFGADFTITAGTATGFDTAGSAAYIVTANNAGGVGNASVWISGDFGKVSLTAHNGTPATQYNTLAYSGTFGSFTVKGDYDFSRTMAAPQSGDWYAQIGYDFGNYNAYFKHSWDQSATLAVNKVGGSGTFGDFTVKASYEVDSTTAAGWDLGVDWASGAISVGADIGVKRTTGFGTFGLSAGYDLGGGASIDFAYNDLNTAVPGAGTEKIMLGVSMGF